jgi:hypothetical protein
VEFREDSEKSIVYFFGIVKYFSCVLLGEGQITVWLEYPSLSSLFYLSDVGSGASSSAALKFSFESRIASSTADESPGVPLADERSARVIGTWIVPRA